MRNRISAYVAIAALLLLAFLGSPFHPALYHPSNQNRRWASEAQNHTQNLPSAPTSFKTQNAKSETSEQRNWAKNFVIDIKITDVLLAAFTGMLVWVGWTQAGKLSETIDQMRKTEERQLRAYVLIGGAGLTLEGACPVVSMKIQNFGHTPAKKVRLWAGVVVHKYPLEIELENPPDTLPISEDILAPGNHTIIVQKYERPLSPPIMADIERGGGAVYVFGEITYIDAFEKSRTTKFIHFCFEKGWANGNMSAYHHGNDYT